MTWGHQSKEKGESGSGLAAAGEGQVIPWAAREAQAPEDLQIHGEGGVWRRKLPVAVG